MYEYYYVFCLYCHRAHRDLHSFPTRRSSDLFGSAKLDLKDIAPIAKKAGIPILVDAAADYLIVPNPYIALDRKSTRLNSSHQIISYAVFCLKKKMIMVPLTRAAGRDERLTVS